jgi:hypothetical protein
MAYLSADYKKQLNYCDELNKLNVYFTENLRVYNYYRLEPVPEQQIITRSNAEIDYNLDHSITN